MTTQQIKDYEALTSLKNKLPKWKESIKDRATYQITSDANTVADEIAKNTYFGILKLIDDAEKSIQQAIEEL